MPRGRLRNAPMAARSVALAGAFLLFLLVRGSRAVVVPRPVRTSFPRAVSDLKEAIRKGLGSHEEGLELSGFDPRDAKMGQSIAYEFHVEIGKKMVPIKLLEDVSRWEFVDFPFVTMDGESQENAESGLAEMDKVSHSRVPPVLPPFQLAGPMELWIQDGDDVRLALPHDVEAGVLKKVMLSDGAKVTVKGAKSVGLRHPIELPLPLNRSSVASSLLTMAKALRRASLSEEKPLLSLQIVGPTSLSSVPTAISPSDKLKLKRLAPGLVELSSSSYPVLSEDADAVNEKYLWPLSSLNGSDSNLRGFEELLASVLWKKGREKGSFRLLKAEVSAMTYVKLGFSAEKLVSAMDVDWSDYPFWKTRPEKIRTQFEVLARVEANGKIVPERIAEIPPVPVVDSQLESLRSGNSSMSKAPIYHPPPDYFVI